MYRENEVLYSEKSPINKAIIKAFLAREVKCDMSLFVEYVLDTGTIRNSPPFTFEDIKYKTDGAACPACGAHIPDTPISSGDLHLVAEMNEDQDCDPEEKFVCPICGIGYPSFDEANSCCEGMDIYQCPQCQNVIMGPEYDELVEPSEMPKEWWAVSPWLLSKLKDLGAPVIEEHNLWGRFEISKFEPLEEDDLIVDICRTLGILDGQKYAWTKYVQHK